MRRYLRCFGVALLKASDFVDQGLCINRRLLGTKLARDEPEYSLNFIWIGGLNALQKANREWKINRPKAGVADGRNVDRSRPTGSTLEVYPRSTDAMRTAEN